jgi:hypothetical protein
MSKRILTSLLLLGAASALTGCEVSQPSPGCIVQDASALAWYAKYTLKNPADASRACGALKGDSYGVFKFTQLRDDNGALRTESSTLTLRPLALAKLALEAGAERQAATALGPLPLDVDGNNFCVVPRMDEVSVGTGASRVAYAFSNVRVYSDPGAPGTQLDAELRYTVGDQSCEYTLAAVWPKTDCTPGSTVSKESCGPDSGINPDFAVTCDPELEVCVPSKPIPSFK